MRIVLPEALHARPANLVVRLAARFSAEIFICLDRCERRAAAHSIMDVLSLTAQQGEEVDITAEGKDAEAALSAIVQLIERRFDADLVPELASAAVEGIGAGRAVVIGEAESDGPDLSIDEAVVVARRELDALIASLPRAEALLFEPVRPVLLELGEHVRARVAAGDAMPLAILEEGASADFDVVADARARLLDALNGGDDARAVGRALGAIGAEEPIVVVVTRSLTPTLVARFPPNVTAIVTGEDQARGTSHAAILARGRNVPLARVAGHVLTSISDGDPVLVDTTEEPSRVWVAPSAALLADAKDRRGARERARAEGGKKSIAHLGIALRVNIGSLLDEVPPGAEGVGLLRTELAFSGRAAPPSEQEHASLVSAIAKKVGTAPLVVRLFDAGGDKPIAWLAPPKDAPGARGIALLFAHPGVLDAQLRGIAMAQGDRKVLIPLTRSAADVVEVRRRLPAQLAVGAMIETLEAANDIDAIVAVADFVCLGTNDLAASALGIGREAASRVFHREVLALVRHVTLRAHAAGRGLRVSVCGEIAGDVRGALVVVGLGVDSLSVAGARVGDVRSALAGTTLDECQAMAERALAE